MLIHRRLAFILAAPLIVACAANRPQTHAGDTCHSDADCGSGHVCSPTQNFLHEEGARVCVMPCASAEPRCPAGLQCLRPDHGPTVPFCGDVSNLWKHLRDTPLYERQPDGSWRELKHSP